jgi:peptidoglycan-associated lipoprotein
MKKNFSCRTVAALSILLLSLSLTAKNSNAAPARGQTNPQTSYANPGPAPGDYTQPTPVPPAHSYGYTPPRKSLGYEHNWYIFFGADGGLATYSAYNSATEASRSGIDLGLRGLIARYWQDWVLDGGLGWHFIQNSAMNPDGRTESVVTRGIYLDLSARYRLNRNWQLGLEGEYWLSPDNGLNPSLFTVPSPSNNGFFLGPTLLYEWSGSTLDRKYRFGGRVLHGINIDTRSVNVIQLFFQFGFDIFDSHHENYERANAEQVSGNDMARADTYRPPVLDAAPVPEASATPWPEPEVLSTPEPLPVVESTPFPTATPPILFHTPAAPLDQVILTLDVNDLPFEFNKSNLPKVNQNKLKKLGLFLKKHNGTWKTLKVAGHTDERGSNALNDRLSKARAKEVRKWLIIGGAPEKKVTAVGYGKHNPKDPGHNEHAWAVNRRVELVFRGAKDLKITHEDTE